MVFTSQVISRIFIKLSRTIFLPKHFSVPATQYILQIYSSYSISYSCFPTYHLIWDTFLKETDQAKCFFHPFYRIRKTFKEQYSSLKVLETIITEAIFFSLGFLSCTFTIRKTTGQGKGEPISFFDCSLPLLSTSQTLRH